MQLAELWPGDGEHLDGGVEFHGARAERDHRGGEREVAGLEAPQVTKHLGFAVITVKDRVREVRSGAGEWSAS